ncbi:MAG: (2Fe-2S)-binding protein [Desulfohalobiaceae bacterium]|nr:(2Fe-2S)-binding protein [Desulfohalobiaceae bacterium]
MVSIRINGQECGAEGGKRLLPILLENGIKVPHLCYHPSLRPGASCKLCVVEIREEGKPFRPRLSCVARCKEGMEVTTDSAMILQLRNQAIGNLLKLAPQAEKIHRIGAEFGLSTGMIPDGCIRCRLCVRVCREVIGAGALEMTRRDGISYVVPSETVQCLGCGTCVNICPTGAIIQEDRDNVRTISIRGEEIGIHHLVNCEICGRTYATRRFLDHVQDLEQEKQHPDIKEPHHYCPTCAKLGRVRSRRGPAL